MRLFNVRPSLTLDARERKFTFTISQFNFPSPSQPHTARGKTGVGTKLVKAQCLGSNVRLRFRKSISGHHYQTIRKFANNGFQYHREVNYNT